jgi:formylglycine-generating enzyme required for sulfatase activity
LKSLRSLSLGTLLLLLPGNEAAAFLARDSIEVAFEVLVNRVDSSGRFVCEAAGEIRAYDRKEWWVTVAEARPDPGEGTEAGRSGIRCGSGSIEEATSDSEAAFAPPYLMAGVSTASRLVRQGEDEQVLAVRVSASLRRRSGVAPAYEASRVEREFFFTESQDAFVPLLVASDAEGDTSSIREVFVRVAVKGVEAEPAPVYGSVSVKSGMSGAELLLDRGVVGTVPGGGETVLRNLPVGLRDLRVRDASGREIRKVVRVDANRRVLADLRPPDSSESAAPYSLTPLGENEQGYPEYRREVDGAVVVRIPAGEFLMGNRDTERSPLEHRVYVSEFLMDKTGVTWGQYKHFAEATGTALPRHEPYWGIHDDHPVVYVTWEEGKAYCEWAGGRLPTEAEREKAARGTDDRMYPWGNEPPSKERAVFRRTWGHEATSAVGTHPAGASPYGLHDMGGNLWEWCSDWYDDDYYAVSPQRDPKGPASGSRGHVVRGGSWDSRPTVLSCSCRSWGHRGYREGDFGFRCAMNAPR